MHPDNFIHITFTYILIEIEWMEGEYWLWPVGDSLDNR